jgi:hypothetical protein
VTSWRGHNDTFPSSSTTFLTIVCYVKRSRASCPIAVYSKARQAPPNSSP